MKIRYEKYDGTFFDLLTINFTDEIYKTHIKPLEDEGRTEKSICYAIWRSRQKLLEYKNDSRFWSILKNEVRKWSWARTDPRWKEYNQRKATI